MDPNFISNYFKESLCTPKGNYCYKNVQPDTKKCMIPCKGLHADVEKDGMTQVDKMGKFAKLIEEYESYKNGYVKDQAYPTQIRGIDNKF